MKLRLFLALGCLAFCLGAGGAGCQRASTLEELETGVASVQRIERVVVATGTIEPQSEVEVRPRIAGIVEKILVEQGETVEEGQILLEIERDLLSSQVREAQAGLEVANVEARFAKIELDRVTTLQEQGIAPLQQVDNATSRYQTAQASLSRARAALESLRVQLRYSTVRSPLAGRVLAVHVEQGDALSQVSAVTGGTPLVSLAATDTLHLLGLVDENEISRVSLGQPARVRTEAYGDQLFEGSVTKISPVGERVQNVTYFEVEVEVTDPKAGQLRPRMSGDADIITEVVEKALVVPETALRYDGDDIFVETVTSIEPLQMVRRDVELGIVDGNHVQILAGLQEGEEVRLP